MARPDDAHAAERATDTTDKSIDVRQTDGDAGGEISGRKADGKGRRWAVVIGIAGYKNEPLRYADKDARLVAEILVAQAGYEARHVYLLTDGREDFEEIPTRENILAALKRVADLTRDDDTLMVFFSGHGKSEDGKGYLVSIDGKLVAIADIRKTLQSAKADRKLLVLDACHSGTTKDAADAGATAKDLAEAVLPSAQTFLTLASCRAE
ncbi:MAG: caspase family protein, partial [Phycisphaerae bacterium]|nr:caspase family protein [Phycisphaerae bacterium]